MGDNVVMGLAIAVGLSCLVKAQASIPSESKCQPVEQRTGAGGCWILVDQPIGLLSPGKTFWYVDSYAGRPEAETAKGPRGTIVQALERFWVLTIVSDDRAPQGSHSGRIGPLPVKSGVPYSAMYMETTSQPGFQSAIHTHAGPEAWFNVAGEMCLETPEGIIRDHAGTPGVFVRGDTPMLLTSTGSVQRRAMVLVLHESDRPPITIDHAWSSKGLCQTP